MRGLKEEIVVVQLKSQKSLQRVVDVVYMVRDQMLEQTREICPNLSFTTDQLDPIISVPREDAIGGSGASEPDADV